MGALQQFASRLKLRLRGKNHVVGWNMTPEEAISFMRKQGKIVITSYSIHYTKLYENANAFLMVAETALGCSIDIIAGREEARLIYLGVTQGVDILFVLPRLDSEDEGGHLTMCR